VLLVRIFASSVERKSGAARWDKKLLARHAEAFLRSPRGISTGWELSKKDLAITGCLAKRTTP
jgi:hypothetical protein